MERLNKFISFLGDLSLFFLQVLRAGFTNPLYFHRLIQQIYFIGIGSLPLSMVIGLVTGLVMTLQFGNGMNKFGGTLYVPSIVSLSLVRELSPVLTSLLVGGRIGAGMSAELSSMQVTDQIMAIRAMGVAPLPLLVIPRILATLFCLPLLSVLSLFMGYLGGLVIAYSEFQMGPVYYWDNIISILTFQDFLGFLLKTLLFALIISVLSCYKGLRTKGGTKSVGESTQWAVVQSSLWILLFDFFMSKVLLFFWNGK